MMTSKELAPERFGEIKNFPITFEENGPGLAEEQLVRTKPAASEYWKVTPVKVPLSIKIDADVLAWFKAGGKGYQTRINAVLRDAMLQERG
ncbi:MAG: BrnA antitoxin family protein [Spirochaetaceae bacterium]|jgi:uncharacterized protein (DUF4415 family)|nr:BrnA antitoxin family protein [Spirochaetaceae bacterium]